LIIALALNDTHTKLEADSIESVAMQERDDFVISGTKLFVADAAAAQMLIVAARTENTSPSNEGITLFLADVRSRGITIHKLSTIASDRKCRVVFDRVKVGKGTVIGDVNKGWPLVKKAMERAAVAKCAEMVGGAQQVLNMTVQYAKDRMQFGKPIGSFQAIQHHCANMAIDVDASRFLTYEAAWTISEGLPCSFEASVAKAWVSDAYQRVMRLAHQIHGAIGFTMEHDLHLFFNQAEAGALDWGDVNFHRSLIARSLLKSSK
jgi:alkylation response protein AidB-like acyl-CoA dehydrogenase